MNVLVALEEKYALQLAGRSEDRGDIRISEVEFLSDSLNQKMSKLYDQHIRKIDIEKREMPDKFIEEIITIFYSFCRHEDVLILIYASSNCSTA